MKARPEFCKDAEWRPNVWGCKAAAEACYGSYPHWIHSWNEQEKSVRQIEPAEKRFLVFRQNLFPAGSIITHKIFGSKYHWTVSFRNLTSDKMQNGICIYSVLPDFSWSSSRRDRRFCFWSSVLYESSFFFGVYSSLRLVLFSAWLFQLGSLSLRDDHISAPSSIHSGIVAAVVVAVIVIVADAFRRKICRLVEQISHCFSSLVFPYWGMKMRFPSCYFSDSFPCSIRISCLLSFSWSALSLATSQLFLLIALVLCYFFLIGLGFCRSIVEFLLKIFGRSWIQNMTPFRLCPTSRPSRTVISRDISIAHFHGKRVVLPVVGVIAHNADGIMIRRKFSINCFHFVCLRLCFSVSESLGRSKSESGRSSFHLTEFCWPP